MDQLFRLDGKTALVTGAARGIGFAIAAALAKAGARIAFNCRSEEHRTRALADYRALGIEADGFLCDITDDTVIMYIDRANAKGVSGGEIQLATDTSDGNYIANCFYLVNGSDEVVLLVVDVQNDILDGAIVAP